MNRGPATRFGRGRRRARRGATIELTPLIDVVFLLIVFLVLTTNFQQPSLELELPSASTEDPAADQAVLVEVGRNGAVRVATEPSSFASLPADLDRALEGRSPRAVRLRADAELPLARVIEVIEAARAARAEAFDLEHDGGGR